MGCRPSTPEKSPDESSNISSSPVIQDHHSNANKTYGGKTDCQEIYSTQNNKSFHVANGKHTNESDKKPNLANKNKNDLEKKPDQGKDITIVQVNSEAVKKYIRGNNKTKSTNPKECLTNVKKIVKNAITNNNNDTVIKTDATLYTAESKQNNKVKENGTTNKINYPDETKQDKEVLPTAICASYVGSNDSQSADEQLVIDKVKISANYLGSNKSQHHGEEDIKEEIKVKDKTLTINSAPVHASYVESDDKRRDNKELITSVKHANYIGSDKLVIEEETNSSIAVLDTESSVDLSILKEDVADTTDSKLKGHVDASKNIEIANVETRTEQSTEVAEDLEYPDDDMSGPATTLMKYKDIMPDADVLKVLADQVRKNPIALKPTLGPLVKRLIKSAKTELEKVWAFYRWIVINIKYDVEGYFGDAPARSTDPASVLMNGVTVCEGYTNLFVAFCEKANIEAKTISGYAKSYGYTIGEDVRKSDRDQHAWNAVLVNGSWFLLDCTWGAGFVKRKDKTYVRWPNDFYFFTDPDIFISDHFPMTDNNYKTSCKWQLLENPITVDTFIKRVNMDQPGKEWGILTHHHPYAVIDCQNETEIMIEESHTPMLDYLVHMRNNDFQLMDQYTFAYKSDSKTFKVHIRPPATGQYMCQIYGRRQIDGRDANLQPLVLYKLNCTEVFDRPREFPKHNITYGPVTDIETYGFSHTGNVLYKAEFGEVTILLNPMREVCFTPRFFIGETEFDYLLDHCFVQYSEDFRHITISLRLPYEGFYRLTLFGKQSYEDDGDTGNSSMEISDGLSRKKVVTPIYNVRFRRPQSDSRKQKECEELKPFVSYLIDSRQASDKESFPIARTAALKYKCCLLQPCDKEVKPQREIKVCVRSLFLERVRAGEDTIPKIDESTFAGNTVATKVGSKLVIYGSDSKEGDDFVELFECVVAE